MSIHSSQLILYDLVGFHPHSFSGEILIEPPTAAVSDSKDEQANGGICPEPVHRSQDGIAPAWEDSSTGLADCPLLSARPTSLSILSAWQSSGAPSARCQPREVWGSRFT